MFGKVKQHFKRAVAVGRGVAHKVHSAYQHGAKIAAGVDQLVRYGKELYGAAAPLLGDFIGSKGQAIMDRGAQAAFGGYDQARGKVMEGHEGVMDKVRGGGVILDRLRRVEAPTQMYNY